MVKMKAKKKEADLAVYGCIGVVLIGAIVFGVVLLTGAHCSSCSEWVFGVTVVTLSGVCLVVCLVVLLLNPPESGSGVEHQDESLLRLKGFRNRTAEHVKGDPKLADKHAKESAKAAAADAHSLADTDAPPSASPSPLSQDTFTRVALTSDTLAAASRVRAPPSPGAGSSGSASASQSYRHVVGTSPLQQRPHGPPGYAGTPYGAVPQHPGAYGTRASSVGTGNSPYTDPGRAGAVPYATSPYSYPTLPPALNAAAPPYQSGYPGLGSPHAAAAGYSHPHPPPPAPQRAQYTAPPAPPYSDFQFPPR